MKTEDIRKIYESRKHDKSSLSYLLVDAGKPWQYNYSSLMYPGLYKKEEIKILLEEILYNNVQKRQGD